MLLFSISIQFEDHYSKEQYANTFGVEFGPFGSVSATIKDTIESSKLSGNI